MSSRVNATDRSVSFFDRYGRGEVLADEIDDYVDVWHDAAGSWAQEQPLHEFLGLTEVEYELWVHDPDSLPLILVARREQRPLSDVVAHHVEELRRAAQASDAQEVVILTRWLKSRKSK